MPQLPRQFLSIDQNSQPLWDTLPKLEVLARHNIPGTHLLEDIDTAFTRRGASLNDSSLEIVRERVYRDGAMDWGAALFYSDFLGRTPIDVRELESCLGMSLKSLAKKTNTSVEQLVNHYSDSDNWQLIGSSYAGDKSHHRTVGDLQTTEIAPFLRQIIDHAQSNLLASFPDTQAQRRIQEWFTTEKERLENLITANRGEPLTKVYEDWMGEHLRDTKIHLDHTSDYFGLEKAGGREASPLLNIIINKYEKFAECYNRAIAETEIGMSPLNTSQGELPLFIVKRDAEARLVRSPIYLQGQELVAGQHSWKLSAAGEPPITKMQQDGIVALAGKALILVLQVRLPPYSTPLVLPYQGSLYMPAAHRLGELLYEQNLLTETLAPLYRVRFHFLKQMRNSTARIRLPQYLREYAETEEISASRFAEQLPEWLKKADATLNNLRDEQKRTAEIRKLTPKLSEKIEALEGRRRELARDPETRQQASGIWKEIKQLNQQQLTSLITSTINTLHVTNIDYWDSRGALMPWSIALGGREFYDKLIAEAEIYAES
ncbi:MAG: hypothetical protein R6V56_00085 [Lentisphaeria bacterium]